MKIVKILIYIKFNEKKNEFFKTYNNEGNELIYFKILQIDIKIFKK